MKQLKASMPDELVEQLEKASAKADRSLSAEIAARIEMSFRQEAILDTPTSDFLTGLALMPAEIALECGAAWHKHAGAHEVFAQAILSRLDELKPGGPTSFGDRPHATTFEDDPSKLASMIEYRLRRQPDFTSSPTRRLLEEEHQRARIAKAQAEYSAERRRRGLDVSLLNEPPGQPKKRGK